MDYVPERIIKADNILNKIMLGLNIGIPILYGSSTFVNNYFEIKVLLDPLWIRLMNRILNILVVLL